MENSRETPIDPPVDRHPAAVSSRAALDLVLVVALTIVAFVLAARLELHEWFSRSAADLERWQVDELPATLTVLIAGLGWFAWRRWRESVAWMAARRLAESNATELSDENRALARRLMGLRESERAALARDLHDEFGQAVHLVRVEAEYLANLGGSGNREADAATARIRAAGEELNRLLHGLLVELRPPLLDTIGLLPALEELCAAWGERSGIACDCKADGLPADLEACLPPEAGIALYRAVQEGLLNVMKHAGARRAEVRVSLADEGERMLDLEIADDGRGMGENRRRGGLGLVGMGERVAAIGARMDLESSPGSGVRIRIRLPLAVRGR